jgi:hypothetical protein
MSGMMETLKRVVKAIPLLGPWAVRWKAVRRRRRWEAEFPGSADYWERRYAEGGDSGHGSYGRFAEFKAEVLNRFVAEQRIESIVEFGCGDGNQLTLASYPDAERRYRAFAGDGLFRFSVGLEDAEDICADLDRVL